MGTCGGRGSRGRRRWWGTAVFGRAGAFGEPCLQGGDRFRGQRCDPVFAVFAVAGDICSGAEVNIGAGQSGELGGA